MVGEPPAGVVDYDTVVVKLTRFGGRVGVPGFAIVLGPHPRDRAVADSRLVASSRIDQWVTTTPRWKLISPLPFARWLRQSVDVGAAAADG
jgi:hypothetical protein